MKNSLQIIRTALLLFTFCFSLSTAFAQGTSMNTTGAAADTSAMLDISSTAKGILIPRMTQAQRDAIGECKENY